MKQIQFKHRNLLLHFTLNEQNEVAQIALGASKEPVNPMSRDYVTYRTLLTNKLGGVLKLI